MRCCHFGAAAQVGRLAHPVYCARRPPSLLVRIVFDGMDDWRTVSRIPASECVSVLQYVPMVGLSDGSLLGVAAGDVAVTAGGAVVERLGVGVASLSPRASTA